jgi:phenylalanyl-tRNA synthetase beta chain
MRFSYNWLQSFFDKKPRSRTSSLRGRLPNPEKLAEILTMHSFEVEGIDQSGNDFVLDIDVLPNRTDCYSHLGMAREISAILGLKLKEEKWKLEEDKNLKAENFASIKVFSGCQRYSARIIFDAKVGESPDWIKERLEVCGIKSINNVVDITNYVMLELGQPLHAFDFEKIEGRKIVVRFAKKGEKILTLDEEKYDLNKDILVIADSKKPIAIAGIKGGKETGISEKTKIILLESANFDPVTIRRGSIKLDLKTDASMRFSHGLDPNLAEIAINRAAYLISKISGGKVVKGILDYYPEKNFPKKVRLDSEKIESLLGIKIPKAEILKILKNLGFKVNQKFIVEIPTFRRDVSTQEDLIEEIGRIYGYEKIKKKFPISALVPPKKNPEIFWENFVKDILVTLGFTEVYNYSFLSKEDVENFGFLNEATEIENPISALYQFLRPSLIPNLIKNVQKNQNDFKEIKIFEIGKIFKNLQPKFGRGEKKALAGILTGEKFFEVKGVIDTLLKKMGISNFYFDFYQPTPEESKISIWQIKKSAEIKIDGEEIGFLGEISKKILEKYKIKDKIVAFDIDFEKLAKLATEEHEYQPFSIYPAIVRDISVLVPRDVLVEEVMDVIERTAGSLIRDIDLFDIYEEIESERKSLAFHIIFQLRDRAILPDEAEEALQKIFENLEKNPNWEVRKK